MLRSGKGEIGVFFTDTSIDNSSLQTGNKGSLFTTGSIFSDPMMEDIKPLMSTSRSNCSKCF